MQYFMEPVVAAGMLNRPLFKMFMATLKFKNAKIDKGYLSWKK